MLVNGILPIATATMAVNPAAGPLTLKEDPLRRPTTMPPTTPAIMPAKSGALEARATPRHRGRATRKTTIDAGISAAALRNNLFMETMVLNNKTPE
jgi:hypothetical protein